MSDLDKFNSFKIKYKGINVLSLSQIFVFELSQKRMGGSILGLVKKLSLENYVKYILALFMKKDFVAETEILFVNDIYNASMISNMRAVQKKFDTPIKEIITDKRLRSNKSRFIYEYLNILMFFGSLLNYLKILWINKKTINALAHEFGLSKILIWFNLVDTHFILNAVEGLFESEEEIDKIVLNTDVHKISRAIVLKAKMRSIKTFVMQHGSTVLEYGYLPVNCDHMLTWGELSNKWFLKRGTPLDKLKALGTPKMDFLHNFVIDQTSTVSSGIQNVLIIINPIGDENVDAFLRIVKSSGIHEFMNLTIKLHPSSMDNRQMVEKYFKQTRAVILKNENTQKLIFETDAVITTTSTVGNEAIAFFKPLVQIKLEDVKIKMDYENYDCCHQIQDSPSLVALLKNKEKLISKIDNYKSFIGNYFFALDGKSAFRIKEFIQE